VVLTGACTEGRPAGAPAASTGGTEVVRSALNASPKTSDFVFEAGNSIVLHSSPLTVTGGDLGALGTGTGPFLSGGVAIELSSGVKVQTDTDWSSLIRLLRAVRTRAFPKTD